MEMEVESEEVIDQHIDEDEDTDDHIIFSESQLQESLSSGNVVGDTHQQVIEVISEEGGEGHQISVIARGPTAQMEVVVEDEDNPMSSEGGGDGSGILDGGIIHDLVVVPEEMQGEMEEEVPTTVTVTVKTEATTTETTTSGSTFDTGGDCAAGGGKEAGSEEPPCHCLTCQESGADEDQQQGKVKCLICYTHINNSPIIFPSGGTDGDEEEGRHSQGEGGGGLGKTVEQHIADILNAEDQDQDRPTVSSVPVESSTSTAGEEGSSSFGDGGSGGIHEHEPKEGEGQKKKSTTSTRSAAAADEQQRHAASGGGGAEEEPQQIKLPIIFQILGCTMEDVDQEADMGLLNQVPLCVPCQSVVTDAALVFKELQRLEQTFGNLRETIKDQIVKSFEANYCKKKKDVPVEDVVGVMGQIDIVRRAIISEGISAAKILNTFRIAKKGRKKKTSVVSKSALYPHVSLAVDKRTRSKSKELVVGFDGIGVKKEEELELEDNQNEDEFTGEVGEEGDNEAEEKEDVCFLQTHSGRRVKRPNYRKWLLGEEEDEEDFDLVSVNQLQEDEVPASPNSEPEWSPGHTDGEDGDFDSETDTSGDSEVEFDSDEERKDLDELGKLLDQGERFADIETGKRVVRARRKKKQNSSSVNKVKCPECPRMFIDEAKKETHFKRKHSPGGGPLYNCEKCIRQFRRPGLLRKHMQKEHGEPNDGDQSGDGDKKRHMCDFCGQKYRNASELRIHVRLHTGETPYKCEHCDKSFVSTLKREFHVEQSHWEIPPLKCEFCPKAFFRQHRLRIHRISHTGEKAYLCEICSQSFSHPTYLKYHQGQHAELNFETFKCKDCGKTFANPTNLRLHTKTVHLKEFRFSCEVCGMGFTHMSHKRIHMRGHTGERPYKCELCNESFRYRDRLRIHMRGHTGERPFICDICKKGFASKSKLKRHEKIHEKNHPNRTVTTEEVEQAIRHRCDDCGKGFAEPQHLSAHRRYCQKKTGSEKEQKKPSKSGQTAKSKNVSVPKVNVTEVTIPQQIITQPQQQTAMLVPIGGGYTYPVTYTYEVPAPYQTGVREYQSYN